MPPPTNHNAHANPTAGGTLVLIGAGGHARVLAFTARRALPHANIHTLDNPTDEDLARHAGASFLVAFGGPPEARERAANNAERAGLSPATLADPTALIAPDATIAPGTVVLANAVVHPRAAVDHHAIINTRAVVEHDARVGAFTHVAPGAILLGHADVGRACHIGAHATIRECRSVAPNTTIAMNAAVSRDLTEPGVYAGLPARWIASAPNATG